MENNGGTLATDALKLAIANADQAIASVSTPGIADDSGDNQFFYFAVTITDTADNSYTSLPQALQVNNTYTTPDITTSTGDPDFDQISLSWTADTSLTYSLYRSTDSACDLGNYTSCANPALYTDNAGGGIAISDTSASVTDTNLEFFTPYYYWLGAQIGAEVVFLNSDWTEQITTSGPVLNDTGITGGGDYPSGFDSHNGIADDAEGAVCNGGYLVDDNGDVIEDPASHSGDTTFVAFADEDCELGRDATLNDRQRRQRRLRLHQARHRWQCYHFNHHRRLGLRPRPHHRPHLGSQNRRRQPLETKTKAFTWYNPDHGQTDGRW